MTTVLAHGCFDLLHLGHIRHLREAKGLGDWLIVSITPDEFVNKGIGRPLFTARERMEAIAALKFVNQCYVNDSPTGVSAIERHKPDIYVKGPDYANGVDPALKLEIEAVERYGGKFVTTKGEKIWSSSSLIKGETLSNEMLDYLANTTVSLKDIKDAFQKADELKIVFVGETIIDEYIYCKPTVGKPSKECCLAVVDLSGERFEGGVVAASKHGDWKAEVITSPQTIHKLRYIDVDFSRKLFESYSSTRMKPISIETSNADVVIVMDFGHGMIQEPIEADWLAVNAQSNAGNHGYNLITKYKRADYACIDDQELRLACGLQFADTNKMIKALPYENTIVTHGHEPTLAYNGSLVKVPTLTSHGLDTMGAGDAFLAVTAPLIAAGLNLEAAALVGNVAGAIKCSIMGHRRSVNRAEILQTLTALLA